MEIYYGTDIVSVLRIKNALTRHPRMSERFFTKGEQAHAEARKAQKAMSYAGIFAAKEAAVKALGCGFRDGQWSDVEIIWENDVPKLSLHGYFAERAEKMDIISVSVSISHEKMYAVAGVTMLGGNYVPGNDRRNETMGNILGK